MVAVEAEDLAWAAGIVDGEGCIAVYSVNDKRLRWPVLRAEVCVVNTDRRMTDKLQELFGGDLYERPPRSERHRPTFEWKLRHPAAATMIRAVRPYLVIKGEQADVFLQFCATIKQVGGHQPGYSDEDRLRRGEMAHRLSRLKIVNFDEAVG